MKFTIYPPVAVSNSLSSIFQMPLSSTDIFSSFSLCSYLSGLSFLCRGVLRIQTSCFVLPTSPLSPQQSYSTSSMTESRLCPRKRVIYSDYLVPVSLSAPPLHIRPDIKLERSDQFYTATATRRCTNYESVYHLPCPSSATLVTTAFNANKSLNGPTKVTPTL